MKRIFSLLTPTVTATAMLINGTTPDLVQELVITSTFNSVVVQASPNSFKQQVETAPPVDGRPPDRMPAGSRMGIEPRYV